MKRTADEEFLRKLSDAADYASVAYEAASREGQELPQMKSHFMTISYYFCWLVNEAVDDGEFADELQETLDDLRERAGALRPHFATLAQFLRTVRRIKYPSDDMPAEEELEDEFDTMMECVDLDEAAEFKEQWLEAQRKQKDEEDEESEDSEKKLINEMYA